MTTAFTPSDSDRERFLTQKLAVLEYLQGGNKLTQDEARERFDIMRLAARVSELRREGWNIITDRLPLGENGASVASYRFEEKLRRESPFLPVTSENIPDELKELPQWVVWRAVERNGKITKPPYQTSGRPAKANDPTTWTSYGKAIEAYEAGRAEGIGFMFATGGGLVGVDLDHCIREDGTTEPKAERIIQALASYTEFSVSGRGVHIILRAELTKGLRSGPVEIYPGGRFFTMTGSLYEERSEIQSKQMALNGLVRWINPGKTKSTEKKKSGGGYVRNDDLIEKAKAAKNGEKFTRLWNGDTSGYPSHSEADLALLTILLYWTNGDIERADILFRQSGLCRDKWTERADYRRFCFDFLRSKGAAV